MNSQNDPLLVQRTKDSMQPPNDRSPLDQDANGACSRDVSPRLPGTANRTNLHSPLRTRRNIAADILDSSSDASPKKSPVIVLHHSFSHRGESLESSLHSCLPQRTSSTQNASRRSQRQRSGSLDSSLHSCSSANKSDRPPVLRRHSTDDQSLLRYNDTPPEPSRSRRRGSRVSSRNVARSRSFDSCPLSDSDDDWGDVAAEDKGSGRSRPPTQTSSDTQPKMPLRRSANVA